MVLYRHRLRSIGNPSDVRDITGDSWDINVNYGGNRPHYLGDMAPQGTGILTVNNNHKKFDAFKANRDSSGRVELSDLAKPDWILECEARHRTNEPWYLYFRGWIRDIRPTINPAGGRRTQYEFTSALGRLAEVNADLYTRISGDIKTGAAMHAALDAVDWPTNLREIDPGFTTVRGERLQSTGVFGSKDALSDTVRALATLARAEMGIVRDDERGYIVFENRERRRRPSNNPVRLGTGSSRIPIMDAQIQSTRQSIVNAIRAGSDTLDQQVGARLFPASTLVIPPGQTVGRSEPLFDQNGSIRHTSTNTVVSVLTWDEVKITPDVETTDLVIDEPVTSPESWSVRITNNGAVSRTVSISAITGTVLVRTAAALLPIEDHESIRLYGRRIYQYPAGLVPELTTAHQFITAMVNIHSAPVPKIICLISGNAEAYVSPFSIKVGDGVNIQNSDVAPDGDYFVDGISHEVGQDHRHIIRLELTDAVAYSFGVGGGYRVARDRVAVRRT